MDLVLVGATTIDLCARCRGTWFDRRELEALPGELRAPESAAALLETLRTLPGRHRFTNPYTRCPVCKEVTNLVNYRGVSGVLLNRCSSCGIWVDGGSMLALARLFESTTWEDLNARAEASERAGRERLVARAERARIEGKPCPSSATDEKSTVPVPRSPSWTAPPRPSSPRRPRPGRHRRPLPLAAPPHPSAALLNMSQAPEQIRHHPRGPGYSTTTTD
jgi:Zn-finger nucleic acid-binding protein